MRQVGVLAAPGLVALQDDTIRRLAVDHEHALLFARYIATNAPGIVIDLNTVQSNIVVFHLENNSVHEEANGYASATQSDNVLTSAMHTMGDLSRPPRTPSELVARMAALDVCVSCFRDGIRAVTHADVTREQVEKAAKAVCDVMRCAAPLG